MTTKRVEGASLAATTALNKGFLLQSPMYECDN